jgi:cytochrome c oxidase subunit 4
LINRLVGGFVSHSAAQVQKDVKKYLVVFVALLCLTAVTVVISYLHLPVREAIILALFVATIKGGLVAAFFMHLSTEVRSIVYLLVFTLLISLALLAWPTMCAEFPILTLY